MNIPIKITNKTATVVGSPVIVCDNSDYKLALTFDAEWADQPVKTARFVFVTDGEVKNIDVLVNGTEADVPKLLDTKEVFIGVYAGDLRTTTPARVPCQLSIRSFGAKPADPTPSQYDQIIALLNSVPGIDVSGMLKYTSQTLSESQKEQARTNIGAVSSAELTEGLADRAPAYTYGTTDITAGSASSSPTGTLHFVYE